MSARGALEGCTARATGWRAPLGRERRERCKTFHDGVGRRVRARVRCALGSLLLRAMLNALVVCPFSVSGESGVFPLLCGVV